MKMEKKIKKDESTTEAENNNTEMTVPYSDISEDSTSYTKLK